MMQKSPPSRLAPRLTPRLIPKLIPFLALAAAGVVGAGCGEDFDPYNRLNSLRVLAIAADPPIPPPGQTTTLSALVYVPEQGASEAPAGVSYAWSWCPFPGSAADNYSCQITQEQLAMLGAAGAALPPLDLGTGLTASLPNAVDPQILVQLCKGVPGAPQVLDCAEGFPVQIKLRIKTATDEIVSVSTVRLPLPDTAPNQRPVIDGLLAEFDRKIVNGDGTMAMDVKEQLPIASDGQVTLPRNQDTVIKAVVAPSQIESYMGRDDDLNPALVRERLTLTWFVESGETASSRTGYVEGGAPLERALRNKWKPGLLKDYAPTTARLIVVVRDNRGGVGWRSGVVTLTEIKP